MPTTAILLRLLLLSFTPRPLSSTHHHHHHHYRRILHQPFQPQASFPPSKPPSPSQPSPPEYPFSSSTPGNSPFFPSYLSPRSPPSPASFASFPANISSLGVPRPSRTNSASSKLIVAAVATVIAAIAVVSVAVFLHIRRRTRNHGSSSFDQCKTQRSDNSSTVLLNQTPTAHRHIPNLQRPSQTSSEFLYLGTLVSTHAPGGGGGGAAFNNLSSTSTTNNNNASSNSRKTDSPELRPLPPLNTQQTFRQNLRPDVVSGKDDESEEFYSPKGSINGRESSFGTESASRRAFAAIEVENLDQSTLNSSSTYSSSVHGSGPGSPVRSVSLSLSPANSLSPRNLFSKSPDLNEIQTITQLPAETRGSLLQEPSPPSSSSPERYSKRNEESLPRISNVSDHNTESPVTISTTVRQNATVIPTPSEIGGLALSSPERYSKRNEESKSSPMNSNVSDHNMKSPVNIKTINVPTPPEIQHLVLPESASALARSSSSPEGYAKSSHVSDQNIESPVRISSALQQNTIEIPAPPPETQGSMFQESASSQERCSTKSEQSSPRNSNADSPPRTSSLTNNSATFIPASPEMQNSVLPEYASASSPERSSRNEEESSPRISNASDQNLESLLRISSPLQPIPPTNLFLLERHSTNQESSPRVWIDSDQSVECPMRISSLVQGSSPRVPPPPPPPPPPPSKVWESPKTPTPPPKKPILPPDMINPLRPIALESPSISPIELPANDQQMARNYEDKESPNKETEYSSEDVDWNGDSTFKPKLKPLHWDKVRASSDREMVWDRFKCSSFKLNEEMIGTLFVVNTPKPKPKPKPKPNPNEATRWQVLRSPGEDNGNRVLDPKKAQNIAILLKALHVTVDEVRECLLEGNADILGTELLESLLKMAPTKEEERKLKEYKEDDSPTKLGAAERFLKAVVDIPYSFKRVDAMLYVSNFDFEVEYLKKSFATLETACEELRTSRMFLKLLDAVLKTGNRMNVGTNRGDAHAFKLDTLLKLVDIKGADGETTLLHFVVQEIIRTEGARLSSGIHHETTSSTKDEAKCRKLGLQVVSSLSSELSNVKKAAAMDAEVLNCDVSKLSKGIENVREIIAMLNEENSGSKFSDKMSAFMKWAEEEIFRARAQESVVLSLVKEIMEYFHGNSAKEEAHPFRIFMVVRDFLAILDRVCKEVGMINERTMVSSAHKFPVPVNPMLQQVSGLFKRQYTSTSPDDDESLPLNV